MAKESLQFSEMFREGLEKLIEEKIESSQKKLNEQEVKQICKELLPDLDKIISDKVKEHFLLIADFIQEKFKNSAKRE